MSNKNNNNTRQNIQPILSRELSLFHLTMMGTGMMIGAGVFVATGISIGVSGAGGILITFALNGLIAIFTAMSFAELSSALPAAGGAYSYVRHAFGGIIGFIAGWMNWFALAVAGSLYAITFSTYTLHLLKSINIFSSLNTNLFLFEKILAIIIAVLFILINLKGVSETGNSASLIALGQTVSLAFIGVMGILVALQQPERLTNFSPFLTRGWDKILVTMGFTYVGFEGFEVIGHAGEEAINPKKNIPKAILYAVILVVTTYIMVAFAAVIGVKPDGMAVWEWFKINGPTGFADAIKDLFPFGGVLVTLAAIFSSTSALNATIYSSARVSFAMGRDGLLPRKMSLISKKRRVPHIALFFSSILILLVAAILPVEDVAASADIMFLLIFLLINVSVIKIRKEMGDELEYGFIMPFFPFIPLIALITQLLLSFSLLDMSITAWLSTLIWISAGLIMYFAYSRKRIKKQTITPILEEKRDLTTSDYRVMVPIGNHRDAKEIVSYAQKIATERQAELVLLSIINVPDQIPLSAAKRFISEKHNLINEICEDINTEQPVHTIIRYSHNIARGIISSVKEYGIDLLILGWKGYTEWNTFELGSNLDRIIESIPCDLMVVKLGKTIADNINKILLPSNGGYHSMMAAGIAKNLSNIHNADITILNVNYSGKENEPRVKRRLKPLMKQLYDVPHNLKIIGGSDIVEILSEKAKDHDIVIIGSTGEGFFQQLLFGTLPEKIAANCENTVILTKKDLGVRSWFKRWLGRRQ